MSASRCTCFSGHLAPVLGMSLAGRTLTELLILGGAVLLVTGAVMVWVLVFRRSRRRTRLYHRHHRRSTVSGLSENPEETGTRSRRGRQRHPHPRPPTLPETGGLPPARGPQMPPTNSP